MSSSSNTVSYNLSFKTELSSRRWSSVRGRYRYSTVDGGQERALDIKSRMTPTATITVMRLFILFFKKICELSVSTNKITRLTKDDRNCLVMTTPRYV